ncbi:MAG TPA: hypothetical protein VF807_02525 [Ktedonobacterales bacterium]
MLSAQQSTTPSPAATPTSSGARAILPILVFMGYLAFLSSGFGAALGKFQALPLYLFLAMLLLTLQEIVAPYRSLARFVFSIAASIFALLFALDAVYQPLGTHSFTRSPWTYLLLTIILIVFYAILAAGVTRRSPAGSGALGSYGRLAADFAGAALLFFVLGFLADLVGRNFVLRGLGITPWPPLVEVSLSQLFHLSPNGPIDLLQGVDVALGLICAAIALSFLVVVGALLPSGAGTTTRTLRSILASVGASMNESLSVALTPFAWLIPAFSIAYLANLTTGFLNEAAAARVGALQLFNPFSPTSLSHVVEGFGTVLVIALAVASAVVAVAVSERDREVLRHMMRVVLASGRTVLLIGGIYILSLALINAVVIMLRVTDVTPFQVGAPGFILLLVAGVLLYREISRAARPAGKATLAKADQR